jgi:hypothetical protein
MGSAAGTDGFCSDLLFHFFKDKIAHNIRLKPMIISPPKLKKIPSYLGSQFLPVAAVLIAG